MHCNWRRNGSFVKATMTRVHDLDMPRPISPVDYRILPPAFAFAFLCAFRFCFLKYFFDITSLFQSLPSFLLSLKVSQSSQRHTKNPHPAHFYPIASLHRTLCNLLCTFLPPRSGSAHYQAHSFKRMSSKSLVVGKKASTEKTEVSLTRS